MSQHIHLEYGKPQSFIVQTDFTLDTRRFSRGSGFLFDGVTVTIPGYPPFSEPRMRGAMKSGWVVPAAGFDPQMMPNRVSAPIHLRPIEGGNPMDMRPRPGQQARFTQIDQEEREVHRVSNHRASTQQRNATNYRRKPQIIRDQEGREIEHGFQTLAGTESRRTSTSLEHAGAAIRDAEAVKIDPGPGRTREQMLEQMDPAAAEQYLAEIEARRSAYAGPGPVVPQMQHMFPPGHPQYQYPAQAPYGQAPYGMMPQQPYGMMAPAPDGYNMQPQPQFAPSPGGFALSQNEEEYQVPNGHTPEHSMVEAEGMMFANTNGPKRQTRLVPATAPGQVVATMAAPMAARPMAPAAQITEGPQANMCRRIAKTICPDFPDNYRFEDSARKKLARLELDFEDRPDVIRAVAAADTDLELRQSLFETFPHAFPAQPAPQAAPVEMP